MVQSKHDDEIEQCRRAPGSHHVLAERREQLRDGGRSEGRWWTHSLVDTCTFQKNEKKLFGVGRKNEYKVCRQVTSAAIATPLSYLPNVAESSSIYSLSVAIL